MTLTLFFLATIGITLHVWLFFPNTNEIRNSQINQYMLSIALGLAFKKGFFFYKKKYFAKIYCNN